MIHWLSDYNHDFALASIPVQLLIILFYSFRRNLPIRSSHCFLAVMISNLTMTLADIVSCRDERGLDELSDVDHARDKYAVFPPS